MMEWLAAHGVEVFGFVTGAVCVVLAARRHIANFPIGIANNLVFIVLFIPAALYADAGLQVIYIVLAVTGWVGWARGKAADDRAATVRMPRSAIPRLAAATLLCGAILFLLLSAFTDSTTEVADAATTAGSLVAQYMLNRRWIESWYLWISVDMVYVGLYIVKGLWITGLLYLLFIGMCVLGLRTWLRAPHAIAEHRTPVDSEVMV
ncbi:MAG: nicotinamide riboside transporter PnuC [Pseudolysinimonas sp.]